MLRSFAVAAVVPLLSGVAIFGAKAFAQQLQPTWSRAASVLDKSCSPSAPKFLSPDHRITIELRCAPRKGYDAFYSLRLLARKKQIAEFALPIGAQEIVWSPDSHAFFLNGGATEHTGFFVKLYTIDEDELREHDVTSRAQRDMVAAFPPCKAANFEDDCRQTETDPKYNISGLAWAPDSKAIFVFAEIPCLNEYGGIRCQSRGYEIEVASGQILKRLSAQQVKQQWQSMAAWEINVPDPPRYGPAQETP